MSKIWKNFKKTFSLNLKERKKQGDLGNPTLFPIKLPLN
jgi:hypothetical protein